MAARAGETVAAWNWWDRAMKIATEHHDEKLVKEIRLQLVGISLSNLPPGYWLRMADQEIPIKHIPLEVLAGVSGTLYKL